MADGAPRAAFALWLGEGRPQGPSLGFRGPAACWPPATAAVAPRAQEAVTCGVWARVAPADRERDRARWVRTCSRGNPIALGLAHHEKPVAERLATALCGLVGERQHDEADDRARHPAAKKVELLRRGVLKLAYANTGCESRSVVAARPTRAAGFAVDDARGEQIHDDEGRLVGRNGEAYLGASEGLVQKV